MTDIAASPAPQDKPGRMVGIDAFRYLILFPIIADHLKGGYRYEIDAVGLTENLGRFVVPFFFITSGYFLGRKDPPTLQGILYLTMRLLPAFLFWLLLYLAVLDRLDDLRDPRFALQCLFRGGPAYHLWFLPALGAGAAGVLLARPLGWRVVIAIGIVLYGIALALVSYRDMLGLSGLGFGKHSSGLSSFLFIAAGFYMGRINMKPRQITGWVLLIAGMVTQFSESWMILATGHGPFVPHLFLIGTIPMGFGAFILAMHIKAFPGAKTMAWLGRASLGMYCCHYMFLLLFEEYLDKNNFVHTIAIVALTALASTLLAVSMTRLPYVRRLVS